MKPTRLVAGIGNILLSDDGFGVEVAKRLADDDVPEQVRIADYGIRGVHLAYELLDGYETLVLIDATPRGGAPGTVYVIEPDIEQAAANGPTTEAIAEGRSPVMDSHSMDPGAVFALLRALGGEVPRVVVVGCEPATVEDVIGLSEQVEGAVGKAVEVVRGLIEEETQRYVARK
jgi:hydrogenase maturation protease